jgi:hypothetical protein
VDRGGDAELGAGHETWSKIESSGGKRSAHLIRGLNRCAAFIFETLRRPAPGSKSLSLAMTWLFPFASGRMGASRNPSPGRNVRDNARLPESARSDPPGLTLGPRRPIQLITPLVAYACP